MSKLFAFVVVVLLAGDCLAVPHSVRKARRAYQYDYTGGYSYGYGQRVADDAPLSAIVPRYGQQGGAGWSQQYLPNVPRPYYQTLPGWQVMPSLPSAPNYGDGW